MEINLLCAMLATYLVNVPFGYIRHGVKKFSVKWFATIHIPIPFVVLFRYCFDLGYEMYTYPFIVFAFFMGQYCGKRIRIYKMRKNDIKVQ
ncbi:hypothetical protein [Ancylomarina sp. 16SWW S1-10-2]|uniref:hypothetical protein n=1 Tax=Ancylomarina sp. 16SWW S1-10-2 TaxID=2499681 RepID=UPI001E5021AD|nr:hypothetical protein [Ancylomarina sp. 16SWW S1-10-2]